MNEYDKQAQEFLDKTGTVFTTAFHRFGYHFVGDKQKRNIFECTLKNAKHTYTFMFGSSLNDSLQNVNDVLIEEPIEFYYGQKYDTLNNKYLSYRDTFTIKQLKDAWDNKIIKSLLNKQMAEEIHKKFIESNSSRHSKVVGVMDARMWTEKIIDAITNKARQLMLKNWGEGIERTDKIPPRPYDVLSGITKYDPGTFDNFCGDFGYDTDSRKAEKVYHSVVDEWKNVRKLFTDEELDLLSEIQ